MGAATDFDARFGTTEFGPWVGIGFALLFLAPFIDLRRPFRRLHFDLLALLAFGVSHAFLNRGELSVSVPLAYAVLAYLLVRMLVAGFRPQRGQGRLVPLVPAAWLAIGIVLLFGARVGLNATGSDPIDVGFASVIGADRITHGQELYDGSFPDLEGHRHPGDVYGPVTYLAYVPFELLFPWNGGFDEAPAAQAAALTFDALTALGLFLLGRRLRRGPEGRVLGLALAFGWLAYPYSLFPLMLSTNDGLIAMSLVFALLVLHSPWGRGALLGLGAAAKVVPLALAPLFATGTGERSLLRLAGFGAALLAGLLAALLPFLPPDGLTGLYDTTLGYQADRPADEETIWFQAPSLDWLQPVVSACAIGLGILVAFVPRTRTPAQVAALGAAVIIAVELSLNYWFYSYIAWFAPLALVALFSAHRALELEEFPGDDRFRRGRFVGAVASRGPR